MTKFYSVKYIIITVLFLIIFLHLVSFVPTFHRSLTDYNQAKRVIYLNDVSDDLYTAVGNFGFERGRVNVVLNDSGPVEKMEKHRAFILSRRADGDVALKSAINKLASFDQDTIKHDIEKIIRLTSIIEGLRKETAKDLLAPKAQRKPNLAESWFVAMTAYIESIESLLVNISSDISDADGMISRFSSLKQETLALRNSAGPEISILFATMLSGDPIKPQLTQKINVLQIQTQGHFHKLEYLSQPLSDPQIPTALKELKKTYYEDYIPFRDTIYPLVLKGGPYPNSEADFFGHGVKTLQQIAVFMETIVATTRNYAQSKLHEIRKDIILQIFSSCGSMLLIIVIFIFANNWIIKPISQITTSILRLAKKDLNVSVPYTNVKNEIGDMARSVEIFKGMAIQLDEDVISLKRLSEERESLINKLQETIDEIKVLRGILPICSFCKKIRNDEGYYEQLESYIHKHSGVDFSHTICPSCVQKHYPEQYTSLMKKKKSVSEKDDVSSV